MSETRLPSDVRSTLAWRRAAASLLDQQLWCFGYDIRRPQGNLLVAAGCRRIAASASSDCASCYQADLAARRRLTLRGFGLLCEDITHSAAVFLRRESFEVSWVVSRSPELPWRPRDVPDGVGIPPETRACAARLVEHAARWIADYEQSVADRLGRSYRQLALNERGKSLAAEPSEVPRRWRQIASEVSRQPELIADAKPRRQPKRRRAARAI